MSRRLRVVLGVLLAAVTLVLVVACGTKESESRTPLPSSVPGTSVTATKTVVPTSSIPAQGNPGGPQRQDGSRPRVGDSGQPAAQPPGGTDNCNENCGVIPPPGGTDNCGVIFCGDPAGPRPGGTDNCNDNCGVICTERFDYTGDPRTPAEINTLGEWNHKCPEPIRPTVTTSPTAQPTVTTPAATTSPAAPTTSSPTVTTPAK
ncbi:hypothetical protein ABZ942_12485 [Nocardia sp. NPDC046473]|uniref:hypothetical protein n=1 Tax=Nocardia sp. NPDC046473 TaxID=3155733 RepID=UPI003403B24B